jgi:ubiquinone biosynthesis monooxygenase Coq7
MAFPATPPLDAMRRPTPTDHLLAGISRGLATLADAIPASRPLPVRSPGAGADPETDELDADDRRLAGALMRVNHVGEICAQALYEGQAASTPDAGLKTFFLEAAREESDHLAWTRQRLDELGASVSLLNPVWYAGALAIGFVAGRAGDRVSLGFMAETERQVERHLQSHLERLPARDKRSRDIVDAMKSDEAGHAREAMARGGVELPLPLRWMMKASARLMTTVAHRI